MSEVDPMNPAEAIEPDPQPYDYPFGAPVTLEQARALAAIAEVEAFKRGWKMAFAVVEPNGTLVYFGKMDGTQYAAIDIAIGKAKSAATLRRSTKILQDDVNGGRPSMATIPGIVAVEGGLPLILGGALIGALGVSGAAARQDGLIATIAAASIS